MGAAQAHAGAAAMNTLKSLLLAAVLVAFAATVAVTFFALTGRP